MAAYNPYVIWLVLAAIVGILLLIATLYAQWQEKKKKKTGTLFVVVFSIVICRYITRK